MKYIVIFVNNPTYNRKIILESGNTRIETNVINCQWE